MVTFRIALHSLRPGQNFVEVLVDGDVCGAIYPEGEKGFKVVSVHISQAKTDPDFAGKAVDDKGESGMWPPIPAHHITLDPGPWEIRDGKVYKYPRPKKN